MFSLYPWLVLALVVSGNCGFWLFCYNRINATGLDRRNIKRLEKGCVLACFLIPSAIAFSEAEPLRAWLFGDPIGWWPGGARWFSCYAVWCVASALVLGPLWLESRRWLWPPPHLLSIQSQQYDVHQEIQGGSTGDRLTTLLGSLPGNQITELEVTHKQVQLPRRIAGIDGFKIGHISDLHFTGQLRQEHYYFVMDRTLELNADLIVIAGDIMDLDDCLPWIKPVLGRLTAKYGCAFVLGNHDRRVRHLDHLLSELAVLKYHDLGHREYRFKLDSGAYVELFGNERPWFERHEGLMAPRDEAGNSVPGTLRIGVSHSPDQFHWARNSQLDLLLAGHTHGGQVRFPVIGPVVAPSWHGSRYASGLFYQSPTLMHVSRGVAGVHPLRWRCPPEISLLTLSN